MPLSPAQLSQYHEEGYAVGDRILDDAELARLRQEIDQLIASLPPGKRPENMSSVHYGHPYFRDLFLSDKLLDIAEQLLGPDLALFTSYIISKRPNDGLAVAWHQDAAFFPIEPMETFTLWLAADDADVENGCMRVIPSSSKTLYPHHVDNTSATTLPLSLDGIDLSQARDVELRAGQFSVHNPFVFHGSNANHSPRRRCGITIKYVPTHIHIDRDYISPTNFDWRNINLFWARGEPGENIYANLPPADQLATPVVANATR
ncbi:MAG: phytanoyl-CoA dioxygenase family protein [Planctomycetota bacterium]|nr:phytanoyl-CoA dioxygenase family protein [Planctomycetota bacterium]